MTPKGERTSEVGIIVILPAQNGKPVIGLADNGEAVKKSKPMKKSKQKMQTTHAQKATSNTA